MKGLEIREKNTPHLIFNNPRSSCLPGSAPDPNFCFLQVIYSLNTKNDDLELEMEKQRVEFEEKLQKVSIVHVNFFGWIPYTAHGAQIPPFSSLILFLYLF